MRLQDTTRFKSMVGHFKSLVSKNEAKTHQFCFRYQLIRRSSVQKSNLERNDPWTGW